MSVIDLSQLISLPSIDMIPVEPAAPNSRPGPSGSFDDYLQRAQSSSLGAGDNVDGDASRNSGQPPVPRTDEPHSKPDKSTPISNNIDDNVDNMSGTESAGNANLPVPQGQAPVNKDKPAGQGADVAKTTKKEDAKKEKRDNQDSAPAGKAPDNQLNTQLNYQTDNTKNHAQPENDVSTIKVETQDALNPSGAALKEAKPNKSADSGGLSIADSLMAGTQPAAGDAQDGSLSAPGKKKATKKTAVEEVKNADKPVEIQATDSATTVGKVTASAAKMAKDLHTSTRDAQGKSANQSEKAEASAARAADAAVSPAVYQQSPAGAATVNPAVLQAAADQSFMAATSMKDKIDTRITDRSSNTASDGKTADTLNALQRLEQSAAKTTTSPQGNVDDARSDLNGVRFVQRVERAFAAMTDQGGTVRLKLNPPELGSLHVEISVNKGVMKARVEAETKEAKNLLLENLPALRDRLAQQNIKIQKFDVDLRDPSSGGMSQQTANQAGTGSGNGGYHAPRAQARVNGGAATTTTVAPRLAGHNGQLNVIV
jgi:flagellar hook-length control protein FliK